MENIIETIDEKVIAVKVDKTFEEGMGAGHLYDCTRGIWSKSRARAEKADYVFAIFNKKVKEVYKVNEWHDELTTEYKYREPKPVGGRIEFTGEIAEDSIRDKYIGKTLPVTYQEFNYYNI